MCFLLINVNFGVFNLSKFVRYMKKLYFCTRFSTSKHLLIIKHFLERW